jgi:ribosome-binding factor A
MVLRYSKLPTQRQLQVAQSIRSALSEILVRGELSLYFENIMVTVSEVRVSADLKTATAFVVLPESSDKKGILKFFNEISPKIRKFVSQKISLRYMPTLRFVEDESVENAKRIEDIIRQGLDK